MAGQRHWEGWQDGGLGREAGQGRKGKGGWRALPHGEANKDNDAYEPLAIDSLEGII